MARKDTKVEVQQAKTPQPAPAATGAKPLFELRQEIDRVFDRALRDWPSFGSLFGDWGKFGAGESLFGGVWGGKLPQTDIKESDKSYTISVELPGVAEADIDVTVGDDLLTVKGEKKTERSEAKESYHVSERSYGSFERRFRLPEDAMADKAKAEFANGVLSISLPKQAKPKKKERKIAVQAKA